MIQIGPTTLPTASVLPIQTVSSPTLSLATIDSNTLALTQEQAVALTVDQVANSLNVQAQTSQIFISQTPSLENLVIDTPTETPSQTPISAIADELNAPLKTGNLSFNLGSSCTDCDNEHPCEECAGAQQLGSTQAKVTEFPSQYDKEEAEKLEKKNESDKKLTKGIKIAALVFVGLIVVFMGIKFLKKSKK
ncbi:MAG TPA: hypothetical protein PLP27_10940 [Crocinitomicaceae bacterium]|nr:hypothetical protein [Crocinitomicaceae bacterium]